MILRLAAFLLMIGTAHAGNVLMWDYTPGTVPPTATIKKCTSPTVCADVATVPSLPSAYALTYPPDGLSYHIENVGGSSNSVVYAVPAPPAPAPITTPSPTPAPTQTVIAYDDTAVKASIAALDTRVTALEHPAPSPATTSRVIVKTVSPTQIEITCVSGAAPAQSLNGVKRTITCP